MNILITGATGFIGSKFIKSLSTKGFKIKFLSRNNVNNYETVICDFLHDNVPDDICKSIDIVFHFAGYAHDLKKKSINKRKYYKVNVEATKCIVNSAIRYKVKKFVYLSSVKARGNSKFDLINDEKSEIIPETDYGLSKLEAENEIIKSCYLSKTNYLILRPALVYGPGVKGNLSLMIKAIENRFFPPLPNILNKKSLVHVDDLIKSINYLTFEINSCNEIFIITDGIKYSTKKIRDTISFVKNKKIISWNMPLFFLNIITLILPNLKTQIKKLLANEFYSCNKLVSVGFKPKNNLNNIEYSEYV